MVVVQLLEDLDHHAPARDEGMHAGYLDRLGAVAYLARPDLVLFGAATDANEIGALVEELRSALVGAPTKVRS